MISLLTLIAFDAGAADSVEKSTKICLRLYESGDYVRALKHCQAAAEQGIAEAQFALGRMFLGGIRTFSIGNVQYTDLAHHYFSLAAEQHHAKAMFFLGYMYSKGVHVDQDDREAANWYQRAAESGDEMAQAQVGYLYMHGKGVEQDLARAIHWTRQAAEQGSASGHARLGYAYTYGFGVPQDYEQSFHHYQIAADQGSVLAKSNLGLKFALGLGVAKDVKKAFRLTTDAANENRAFAESNLGWFYLNGIGTRANRKKAHSWFRKSARNDNRDSAIEIVEAYQTYDNRLYVPTLGYAWIMVALKLQESDAENYSLKLAESIDEADKDIAGEIANTILSSLD